MKRILTSVVLFLLLSFCAFAQTTDNTLKFLGIPVDGPEQQMVASLKSKGFRYDLSKKSYVGQFNGETVQVLIHTNHNIVDRIYVAFPPTNSESEIKNRFNRLISQFDNNKKYFSFLGNEPIPSDESISTEMLLHDKRYEAAYRYINPDIDPEYLMNAMVDKLTADLSEEDAAKYRAMTNAFMKSSEEDQMETLNQMMELQKEIKETPESLMNFYKVIQTFESLLTGQVWFTIHKTGGLYNIGLYYDNLANKANGEDL